MFTLRSQSRWRATNLIVRDTNDLVLFRLNHNTTTQGLGCKWTVQLPSEADEKSTISSNSSKSPKKIDYRSIGSSDSSKSWSWKIGIDLSIENLVGDGKPITLKIRQPKSRLDPSYHVLADEKLVARITKEKVGARSPYPSWEIEVAQGFDMALAFVIGRVLVWHPLIRAPAQGGAETAAASLQATSLLLLATANMMMLAV